MSVTGIVLFVIFLLVKNWLDKKKRKERRQRPPDAVEPTADLQESGHETQLSAVRQEEMQDLLHRFFSAQSIEPEEKNAPQAAAAASASASELAQPTTAAPHRTMQRRASEHSAQEQAATGAVMLDAAPAAMLQAVVLAEVIGRPKAQRRRSPYFRP